MVNVALFPTSILSFDLQLFIFSSPLIFKEVSFHTPTISSKVSSSDLVQLTKASVMKTKIIFLILIVFIVLLQRDLLSPDPKLQATNPHSHFQNISH